MIKKKKQIVEKFSPIAIHLTCVDFLKVVFLDNGWKAHFITLAYYKCVRVRDIDTWRELVGCSV